MWTIKKYKDQQAKNNSHPHEAASSASYNNDTQTGTEQALKEKRAKLAALRREQLMAQMARAQKSFISSNAELFNDVDEAKVEEDSGMEWQTSVEEHRSIACLGNGRKIVCNESEAFTCILCSSNNKECMVFPAFIQKSSVLRHHHNGKAAQEVMPPSPYVNSCGHEMHASCWKEYYDNELLKETRRPFRNRNPSIFNIEKNQFLCPLCRFLSNSVLPIIPPLSSVCDVKAKSVTDEFTFKLWHQLMGNYIDSLQFMENNSPKKMEQSSLREELQKNYRDCVIGFLKKNCNFDDLKVEQPLNLNAEISKHSKNFVNAVKDVAPATSGNEDIDLYTVTWQACAYTIESLEMFMRATEKPLKDKLSIRYEKSVSGLVRLCGYYGRMNVENLNAEETPTLTSSYCTLLMHARDLYDNLFGRKPDSSILQWDVFNMLVSLLFTTRAVLFPQYPQYLIPRGDSLDFTIFETMFSVCLMKIIMTAKLDSAADDDEASTSEQMETDEELYDGADLVALYEKFNIYRHDDQEIDRVKVKKLLVDELKEQSRVFLRCSCILFHFLTEVPLPDEMAIIGGDTFEIMAGYLNLNKNVLSFFNDSDERFRFLCECGQHRAVEIYRKGLKDGKDLCTLVPPSMAIRQLVTLPDDYSDLMNSVSLFTCRNNEREDSRNPTMCLVCGEILCSQTYCCQRELNQSQVGACNYHTEICGAGAGIYLRIRESEIVLLGQGTGCFLTAPYLDDYGETDQGLRRGNPLHLCRDSYKKLQLLWLGHGIHEEIARKTEAQSHIYQIQWTHL